MKEIKTLSVVKSKYTNDFGETKSRWANVGSLYQRDDGSLVISIDAFFNFAALPRQEGSDRVFIGCFDPKPRENQQQQPQQQPQAQGQPDPQPRQWQGVQQQPQPQPQSRPQGYINPEPWDPDGPIPF